MEQFSKSELFKSPEDFLSRFTDVEPARKEFQEMLREQIQVGALVQSKYIEMMAAAYFQVTKTDPREVELVQEMDGSVIRFYFRKKETE